MIYRDEDGRIGFLEVNAVTARLIELLVEGNVGTAYRHRAQILPIAFLFCAVGLQDWLAVRSQRRSASMERRRQAEGEVARPRAGFRPSAR